MKRLIEHIIIHCSDTPQLMDIGVSEIRRWHINERGWKDIAYHFVIRRNGTLERGRALEIVGSHARGHNARSIGICWIGGMNGEDNRTKEQKKTMMTLIKTLRSYHPKADIIGHRDIEGVAKDCPSFDVKEWINNN